MLDPWVRVAQGLRVELYDLVMFDVEGGPDELRQKLAHALADIPAHELRRVLRVLEALVH